LNDKLNIKVWISALFVALREMKKPMLEISHQENGCLS